MNGERERERERTEIINNKQIVSSRKPLKHLPLMYGVNPSSPRLSQFSTIGFDFGTGALLGVFVSMSYRSFHLLVGWNRWNSTIENCTYFRTEKKSFVFFFFKKRNKF